MERSLGAADWRGALLPRRPLCASELRDYCDDALRLLEGRVASASVLQRRKESVVTSSDLPGLAG